MWVLPGCQPVMAGPMGLGEDGDVSAVRHKGVQMVWFLDPGKGPALLRCCWGEEPIAMPRSRGCCISLTLTLTVGGMADTGQGLFP
jgi:hypothetical protein